MICEEIQHTHCNIHMFFLFEYHKKKTKNLTTEKIAIHNLKQCGFIIIE